MASRRPLLPLAIAASCCAVLLLIFGTRFLLIEYFVRRMALPFIVALAGSLAAVGCGALARLAFSRILRTANPPSRLSTDFLVGLPVFGGLCFLAGVITVAPAVAGVLLVGGIALGAITLRRYETRPESWALRPGPATTASIAIIGVVLAVGFLNAQAPPFTLDEVAYHLAIPKTWALEGRTIDLPLISHSYFPLGIESASLPLFALIGNDAGVAAHWMHLFAALATIVLLHSLLRERTSPELAVVATAAIAAIPPLAVTTGWAWLEWPLLGIALATFSAIESFVEERAGAPAALATAVMAGSLTKYTFGVFLVAAAAAAFFSVTPSRRRPLLTAIIAGGIGGSIFFVRNLVLTGNPFAPFFGDLAPSVSGFRAAGGLREIAAGYLFDPALVDESLAVTAPLLLILALFALRELHRLPRAMTLAMLTALAALLLLTPSSRILLPMVVVAAIGGVTALDRWIAEAPHFTGALARGALVAGAVLQLFLVIVYADSYRPTELLTGAVSEEQFLERARNMTHGIRSANRFLPEGSRALVVGIHESYWFDTAVRGGGNFDGERVNRYLEAASPAELRARLRRDGITHVVVAGSGIAAPGAAAPTSRRERFTRLSGTAYAALDGVLGGSTLIGAENGVTVFGLR